MKKPIRYLFALTVSLLLTVSVFAGPEPISSGKDVKEVVQPAPPPCDWTGFYVGANAGGQFGHSETHDLFVDEPSDVSFGYRESSFSGGGEIGYNWQWKRLVLGPEFDAGYMDLQGSGLERNDPTLHGTTDSDFFTTLRGRIGVDLHCHGCWLLYATGGAIGVHYTTRFHVDPDYFDARTTDFDWGYCVGGGLERMINRHWSIKVEYLYFALDHQGFSNSSAGVNIINANYFGETFGHIVRAGVNHRF